MNNNIQETPCTQTKKRGHQSIFITKCLAPECTGFYTDSIDEAIFIRCLDPKHNIDEVGHQPTPTVQQSQTIPFPKRLENENR
jgi:hypothetical protein